MDLLVINKYVGVDGQNTDWYYVHPPQTAATPVASSPDRARCGRSLQMPLSAAIIATINHAIYEWDYRTM